MLDFHELCGCLPAGGSVRTARRRLGNAIAAKSAGPATQRIPGLEAAHGYGEAQGWGMDLRQDLADLRAGRIGWGDIDRGICLVGPPGTGKTLFARILAKGCHLPRNSVRQTPGARLKNLAVGIGISPSR